MRPSPAIVPPACEFFHHRAKARHNYNQVKERYEQSGIFIEYRVPAFHVRHARGRPSRTCTICGVLSSSACTHGGAVLRLPAGPGSGKRMEGFAAPSVPQAASGHLLGADTAFAGRCRGVWRCPRQQRPHGRPAHSPCVCFRPHHGSGTCHLSGYARWSATP